jgi:hypothetical protein
MMETTANQAQQSKAPRGEGIEGGSKKEEGREKKASSRPVAVT